MNYSTEMTIGMDLGNKKHEICILDTRKGETVKIDSLENEISTVEKYFKQFKNPSKILIAIEAGTHSPWLYHLLQTMGFEILVGNPRKLRMIWQTDNKSDKRDAEMLARIARFDKKLLSPIQHRNMKAHKDLNIIKCRDALVSTRTDLINTVRGLLKSQGLSVPSCSTEAFVKKALSILPSDISSVFCEVLNTIVTINQRIKNLDRLITKKSEEYPEVKTVQQIKGVGPITSLAFILTLENNERFKKSRDVGPYIGLVPKRDQSGEMDKQLSITKAGNRYLRKLLVNSAHYILGPFGEDCDLRRHGERIAAKGGKIAKKKAVVAVARKLAILMHSLWRSGEIYEPLRKSKSKTNKAA